jgi:hypothetical protein
MGIYELVTLVVILVLQVLTFFLGVALGLTFGRHYFRR